MKIASLRNFAIISSPFQLLSLKELVDEKGLQKIHIVAIFKSEYEITKIKEVSNFTNLKISKWVKSTFIMTHIKLFFWGLKLNKIENFIFSSLFDNRMLLLSRLVKYQNIILIDDGTESIAALKSYKDNTNLFDSNLLSILIFFRISFKFPKNIIFYSVFNLTKNNIKPSYNFIKSKIKFSELSSDIFFVGQPLYEMLEEDFYHKTLKTFANKNKNKNIKYFPHRSESKESISMIEQSYGYEIVEPDLIFECYLATINHLPLKIISFYSTVLFTSSLLLMERKNKIQIEFISLPKKIIKRIPYVNLTYDALNSHEHIKEYKFRSDE